MKAAPQRADAGELALANGSWVKLICGASNQDLATIGDLCALFAVAGVHCVDVAADLAVVRLVPYLLKLCLGVLPNGWYSDSAFSCAHHFLQSTWYIVS